MLAKYDQGHHQTAMRSAGVIGGWGIYMLLLLPEHSVYKNWNIETLIT